MGSGLVDASSQYSRNKHKPLNGDAPQSPDVREVLTDLSGREGAVEPGNLQSGISLRIGRFDFGVSGVL